MHAPCASCRAWGSDDARSAAVTIRMSEKVLAAEQPASAEPQTACAR